MDDHLYDFSISWFTDIERQLCFSRNVIHQCTYSVVLDPLWFTSCRVHTSISNPSVTYSIITISMNISKEPLSIGYYGSNVPKCWQKECTAM
jgi:hypothetical protein